MKRPSIAYGKVTFLHSRGMDAFDSTDATRREPSSPGRKTTGEKVEELLLLQSASPPPDKLPFTSKAPTITDIKRIRFEEIFQ
eukprot:g47741.t1